MQAALWTRQTGACSTLAMVSAFIWAWAPKWASGPKRALRTKAGLENQSGPRGPTRPTLCEPGAVLTARTLLTAIEAGWFLMDYAERYKPLVRRRRFHGTRLGLCGAPYFCDRLTLPSHGLLSGGGRD